MTISLAETNTALAEVIERALRGEGVVVTRNGEPVAEVRPVRRRGKAITQADIDRLREIAIDIPSRRSPPAGALVSQMRDEEWGC